MTSSRPRRLEGDSWQVTGIRIAADFLREVPALLPDATTMYLEGQPYPDVQAFLSEYIDQSTYGAPIGTTWPKPQLYSLTVSPQFFARFAALAEHHAEPEICDHVHLYKDYDPLANWFDAFSDPLYVTKGVARDRMERFCRSLNATFESGAA